MPSKRRKFLFRYSPGEWERQLISFRNEGRQFHAWETVAWYPKAKNELVTRRALKSIERRGTLEILLVLSPGSHILA